MERERKRHTQSGMEKRIRRCDAMSAGISSDDEAVTVHGDAMVEKRRRESPEIPCMESRGGNRPARPGRQPCWLHGRQAAASRLTAAAHYTRRERERETARDISRGG